MNATDILKLLKEKHAEDVFVPECKFGPTGITGRIDAWVMTKSWAHPLTIAYETKVSRSDFLNDNKWQQYLPHCNQFWFVTAPGICQKREIPQGAGWMEVSLTGTRLFTRVKAPYVHREIPEAEQLFRYLLMSRTRIVGEYDPLARHGRAMMEQVLSQKAEDAHFGALAGKRIHELIKKRISLVEIRNIELEQRNKSYDDVRAVLKELGMDPTRPSHWGLARRVKEWRGDMPESVINEMEHLKQQIEIVLRKIKPDEQGNNSAQ